MGLRVVAAVSTATALTCVACGLGLAGLGEAPGGGVDDGDGADAVAASDGTVPGSDADAEPVEAALESGSAADAPGEAAEATTIDSPAAPVCPPGVVCNGACSAATDCRACPGAPLLCGATGTCASDCASCGTGPVECYACDVNRQNPVGSCQRDDPMSYCLDTNYAGAYAGQQGYHCGCTTAADCPGDSQVCIMVGTGPFACFTCGEAFTKGFACKASGKCNDIQATCN
jgi:hypothetical protein